MNFYAPTDTYTHSYMLINLESVLTTSSGRAEVARNKHSYMYGGGKRGR